MRWPTNVTEAVAWVGGKIDALRCVVTQSTHARGDGDGEAHVVLGWEILARLVQVVSATAVRTNDGVSSMLASPFDYDGSKHDLGEPFDAVFSPLIKTAVVTGVLPVAPSERLAILLSQAHGRLVFRGEPAKRRSPPSRRLAAEVEAGRSAASATAPAAQPVPTRKRPPIDAAAAGRPASAAAKASSPPSSIPLPAAAFPP